MVLPIHSVRILEAIRTWGGQEGARVVNGTVFLVLHSPTPGAMTDARARQLVDTRLAKIVGEFVPVSHLWEAAKVPDLQRELRFARKTISQLRRETNEFDEGRAIANKALKRLKAFFKSKPMVAG